MLANFSGQPPGCDRIATPTPVEQLARHREPLDASHRLRLSTQSNNPNPLASGNLLLNQNFQLPSEPIAIEFANHMKYLTRCAHGRMIAGSVSWLSVDSLMTNDE